MYKQKAAIGQQSNKNKNENKNHQRTMDDKLAEKREILMSLDAYKHRISITRIFQLAKLLHISSA